ncbi:MAG: hypothetical protein QHC89_29740 [Bosea sp. (in: a-proteobacteria)]|nr:hypothetical protein [Bosea sp. (in: a-proteobacteria)]
MRGLLLAAVLVGAPSAAHALELAGRYGYAGEWAVTAKLPESNASTPAGGLAGELHLKHLAMCGPGEISEKSGTISVRRAGRRYAATLTIADESCTASGILSEDSVAFADCGKAGQVPLRLWPK